MFVPKQWRFRKDELETVTLQSLILDVLTTLYTSDAVIEQVPGISNKYPK